MMRDSQLTSVTGFEPTVHLARGRAWRRGRNKPPGARRVSTELLIVRVLMVLNLLWCIVIGLGILGQSLASGWTYFVGLAIAVNKWGADVWWDDVPPALITLRLEPPRRRPLAQPPPRFSQEWFRQLPCSPTVH